MHCPTRPFLVSVALSVGLWLPTANAETVTFQKRPTQVGDVSVQSIRCDLDLEMSIRQGGQVVQSQQQELLRSQSRHLSILSVGPQAATAADVRFDEFKVSVRGKEPEAQEQTSPQPVRGKTYRVRREGQTLLVSYPDGTAPPAEEKSLVESSMESFGLPNPIAGFFAGRTLQVGETVELPPAVARELLGFSDSVGNVTKVQLTLDNVQPPSKDHSRLAVFDLLLVADHGNETDVSIRLNGRMVFEVDTCRAVRVHLTGPVRASEVYGPPEGQFEVQSEGSIVVAVDANYGSVRR